MSSAKLWTLFGMALVVVGTAQAQLEPGPLSLPPSPPLKQTITYVDKQSVSDFRGPGRGEHLQYFPAFGLLAPATNLRTDCDECFELTPNFENFHHHAPNDPSRRTFSPDAPGFGEPDDVGYIPEGVKTAGGYSTWDSFILPDGTAGLSGSTFDPHACGNPNTFINQIRLNTPDLHDFCVNVITDNTDGAHDPDVRLEARAESASGVDVATITRNDEPQLFFDGQTDMYTFRYMGMQEGDRIALRIAGSGGSSCSGPGIGGIMISHISTCTPPPGTCTPECGNNACGDDGCGGSCGICPRSDKLVNVDGEVVFTIVQNGVTVAQSQSGVDAPVEISGLISKTLDDLEAEFYDQIRQAFREAAGDANLDARNYRFRLKPKKLEITFEAMPAPNEGLFKTQFTIGGFRVHVKMKPNGGVSGPANPNFNVEIEANDVGVRATFNPATGEILGPWDPQIGTFAPEPEGIADVSTDVDTNSDWDALDGFLDALGGAVGWAIPLANDVIEFLELGFEIPGIPEVPGGDNLASQFQEALMEELISRLGPAGAGELDGLLRPASVLIPDSVQIGGVNYAPLMRNALLNPVVGQVIRFEYDDSSSSFVPNIEPWIVDDRPRITLNIWDEYSLEATVRTRTLPPVRSRIESAHLDASGDFVVEGWVCAEELEDSFDVGVFSNGQAIKIDRADLVASAAVMDECQSGGTFDQYGFSIAATWEELGTTNSWLDRVSVIAGISGFEKDLGEVSRSWVEDWMDQSLSPFGNTFNTGHENKTHVADFNGDGLSDFMWEWNGAANDAWVVATSNGVGFDAPETWLDESQSPTGKVFNPNALYLFHVADFNGDGRADFMWKEGGGGWYVALANASGVGFTVGSTPWLPHSVAPFGNTFNDNAPRNRVADFNADGKADYMWEQEGAANDRWVVALSNGNGFAAPQSWLEDSQSPTGEVFNPNNGSRLYVADFNGDDRADLMWEYDGWYVAVAKATGNGFHDPTLWLADTWPTVGPTFNDEAPKNHVGDFNGDGSADLMWEWEGAANDAWIVALSFGFGFGVPSVWLDEDDLPSGKIFNPNHGNRQFVVDMDADLRDDYMFQWDERWWIARANGNGTGFEAPIAWLSSEILPAGVKVYNDNAPMLHFMGDFDGDEFPDLLWQDNGWHVGSTLLPGTPAAPPPPPGGGGC